MNCIALRSIALWGLYMQACIENTNVHLVHVLCRKGLKAIFTYFQEVYDMPIYHHQNIQYILVDTTKVISHLYNNCTKDMGYWCVVGYLIKRL